MQQSNSPHQNVLQRQQRRLGAPLPYKEAMEETERGLYEEYLYEEYVRNCKGIRVLERLEREPLPPLPPLERVRRLERRVKAIPFLFREKEVVDEMRRTNPASLW